MSPNTDTMFFVTARSLDKTFWQFAQESEHLRERLGATTLLINLARKALADNRQAAADRYLGLAEKAARGSENAPNMPRRAKG
jgi:ABC-type transporter Mla subunit MlaD